MDILKERCEKIIKAGANVVFTCRGLDDIANKYFVEAGILAVRRVDKADIRRICKSTGGICCYLNIFDSYKFPYSHFGHHYGYP